MVENKSIKSRIRTAVIYVIVLLLAVVSFFPLWNIVCISLSSSMAVAANSVGIWPVGFNLSAYEKILEDSQFWRSFLISVVRVILSLGINMLLIVLSAYPLSKTQREFPGRNVYMTLFLIAMLFSGGMIPTYLVVKKLHLLNSVWALVLPGAVPVFSVIMVMNFFRGIPKALEEAAIIDGATPSKILGQIFIPCSKPVLATVALFSIVGNWNDFFNGLIYISKPKNYPLMSYIQSLNISIQELVSMGASSEALADAMQVSNKNLNAAKIIIAMVPLVMIYPFLQKYLITGMVMGAVKE